MRNALNLFKDAAREFSDDKAPRLGAALAYYTMFSIAPLLLVVIAIAGFVFGREAATGEIFAQLKDALNTIWNVEPKKSGGIWGLIRDRFLSMAMVLGVGFLLLVSLALDAVISGFAKFAGNRMPGGEALWQTVQLVISFGVVT